MLKCFAILLVIAGAPAGARSLAIESGTSERDAAPSASEVIAELYEFDRFQQDALDSADLHGNDRIRNLAIRRAEQARQRDRGLVQVQQQAKMQLQFDCQSRPRRADLLAALEISEGPDFVRIFHQVEATEHKAAISLLRRYLASPDSEAVRAFATEQLPAFVAALEDSEAALDER